MLNSEIIPVKSGSKYGYVDREGSFLINPQFDRATFFWGDMALVISDGLYGYIDTKGNYTIPPTYRELTTFTEGIAWSVKKEGFPIAINKKGDILFNLKEADKVYSFSNGMARYRIVSPYNEKEYLYGFINKKGETVIPPTYSDAEDFSEKVAAVANENGDYGYINKVGELVINYQFEDAKPFHKGRAVVCSNHAYGTIDRDGKYIINPQFGYMIQDEENYAIRLQDGRQWGWCDEKGKIFINPQFDAVEMFGKNDLAPVRMERKVGFINRKGAIAINPQFENATPFCDNSYAMVEANSKWGAVGKDGRFIFNPQFNDFGGFLNTSVTSDYFNMEAISAVIQALISLDKIDKKIDFTTSLASVMSEYGLNESSISKTKESHQLKEIIPSKDATITLSIIGSLYDKVSDGWWGYNYVLDRNRIPSNYLITINLKNKGDGKAEKLIQSVFNHFKAQASAVKEYPKELDYGIFHLTFTEKWNKLLITCSKR